MKKLFHILSVIAAACVTFSCSKVAETESISKDSPAEETIDPVEKAYEYTFAVSNGDASNADKDTKSFLNSDANGLFLQWESTDKLNTWALYTGGEGAYSYKNESSIDASTSPVTFTIVSFRALAKDDMVYAMYPYTGTTEKTPKNVTMEIPAIQTQVGANFNASAMPMVAEPFGISAAVDAEGSNDETSKVHFYNIGAIVEFDILSSTGAYASESIESVTFTSTSDIAGEFSLDLTGVDVSDLETSLSISGYSETSVTTNVTSLTVGDATSVANAKKVYMVLAPGSYTGTVTVVTSVAEYEFTISSAKEFQRAKVKRLGLNLESNTCTRVINAYDIPATINFKAQSNVDYVRVTGADYYATNASFFYGSALRFDETGEQIIIPTKTAFGDISIVALYNTSSTPTSTLKVYGSPDGSTYTEIATPSFTHGSNVATPPDAVVVPNVNTSYRYIKMVFTSGTGKLAMGSISIAAPDLTPRIVSDDITGVAAVGVKDEASTYSVLHFADDVEVSSVDGCVSEALAMDGGILYTVTPNYTGAVRSGTIVLWSAANHSVTKTINVEQDADVFTVSSSSVLVGSAASATVMFTVTSTYDFTVASSDVSKLTASPTSGTGSTSPQTITVTAVTANDGAQKELGTITVTRTVDDNDALPVTVNQAAKGAKFSLTLSFPDENSANNKTSTYSSTKDYKITLGTDEYTWSISNFNNNQWSNSWAYIRGGIKAQKAGTALTWNGSITTTTVIPSAISEVVVDYGRITVGSGSNVGTITTAKLEVSTSSSFATINETINGIPTSTGEYTYTIETPISNAYYRLSYSTSNKSTTAGVIQIDSITYNE